jgi:hypothetical protein
MLYIYTGIIFTIFDATCKLSMFMQNADDDRFLELRMRYEDSRKKLLGIITEKGVSTDDRQKLLMIVTRTFDQLFSDIKEDTFKVYM